MCICVQFTLDVYFMIKDDISGEDNRQLDLSVRLPLVF